MKKARLALAVFLAALAMDIGVYFFYPNVSRLKRHHPARTAFMIYRERQWRREGLTGKRIIQRWVPYSRISPYIKKAVLIGEDGTFWRNDGFDVEAIKAAMLKDIQAGRFKFGASTITQQLARNLWLSPAKNPLRKIKEAILAWRLNRDLPKRRILELYLNEVEWGDGIFGIGAASYHYFGKPAGALAPMEAARLAAVLPNPIRFSPTRPGRYVRRRSGVIYGIMVARGAVKALDAAVARMEQEGPSGTANSPGALPNPVSSNSAAPPNGPALSNAAPGGGRIPISPENQGLAP